jgi:hypothetical protein
MRANRAGQVRRFSTQALVWRIVLVSLLLLAGSFGLFLRELALGHSLAEARTVALNVFVVVEAMYLFNCRSLTRSALHIGLFSNPAIWYGVLTMAVLQALLTYLPLLNRLFATAPIGVRQWLEIFAVGLSPISSSASKSGCAKLARSPLMPATRLKVSRLMKRIPALLSLTGNARTGQQAQRRGRDGHLRCLPALCRSSARRRANQGQPLELLAALDTYGRTGQSINDTLQAYVAARKAAADKTHAAAMAALARQK